MSCQNVRLFEIENECSETYLSAKISNIYIDKYT